MKTMKHIIWMAVLVLTAATWSACSNMEDFTATEQSEQPHIYTVTTTLSPRSDVATRSTMTENGGATGITAEWAVGDQLYVGYNNTSDNYVETTAEVTAVNPTTKAATITLTLTDPKNDGYIEFGYPRSYWELTKKPLTDQIGTLDDINANFAAISGYGNMAVSGSDVTLPAVTMTPLMCIWKFSFKDGENDITSAITKLVIDYNQKTYTVTPSSLDNIYVAMYGGVNAKPICITAETATGVYRKAASGVTLDEGKTYTTTGLALKKAVVGKVFGADGNIYDNAAAATTAGTSAVALITYVGSATGEAAPYNHGLALSMSDANGGSNCAWTPSSGTAVHTYTPNSSSFTSESGLQYNATQNTDTYPAFKYAIANNDIAAPTGCSDWFLASGYQWDQMIIAAGNYNVLRDGFNGVGGSNMQGASYWSSTEESGYYAWTYYFFSGYGGGKWVRYSKVDGYYVRSALAF